MVLPALSAKVAEYAKVTHWPCIVFETVVPDQVQVISKRLLVLVLLRLDFLQHRAEVHRLLDYCVED